MTDPIALLQRIDQDAADLDRLSKAIHEATDRLDAAENNWELVFDDMGSVLKEQMVEEGRKGDPAEHWITSHARKQYRPVWIEYRQAKRRVEKLDRQLRAKRSAINGRQSELGALRDELRAVTS